MAPRRTAGFTLLELMVIVVITAILLRYAIPSVAGTIAERRALNASLQFVRMQRAAHDMALTGEGASTYALFIQPATGRADLVRGATGRCAFGNWQSQLSLCAGATAAVDCPMRFDIDGERPVASAWQVVMRLVPDPTADLESVLRGAPSGQLTLCYESTGDMFWSTAVPGPAMNFVEGNGANGGAFVVATAAFNGANFSVPRVAVLPWGGSPRRLR